MTSVVIFAAHGLFTLGTGTANKILLVLVGGRATTQDLGKAVAELIDG